MRRLIYIFSVFFLLNSCTTDKRREADVSQVSVNLVIERLDQEMMACQSQEEVGVFLSKHPDFKKIFLQTDSTQTDALLAGQIWNLVQNEGIQKLYRDTQQVYGNFSDVRSRFEDAFKHIKYYYPRFKVPKVQTAITGLGSLSGGQDLYVSDSLVIISLDFYLGEQKASFVPDVPQYVLRRFQKEYIVPAVMLLYGSSGGFNRADPGNESLLAEMIFYGKAFAFAQAVQPQQPDSVVAVIFTGKQLQDAAQNKGVIWSHFVEKKLLYETSHFKKVKYIGDRPYTAEIGVECPGAIGRWLGWEIVKKYQQENPGVTLPELMADARAQQIFEASNFKGK